MQQAVERRLRSDVPVVTYISGGLDSTVVLGLCGRHRGERIPAFTIGFEGAGPDERVHSTEAARVMGSPLTTVIMDKSKIGATFPELVRAAEGPVLDTSCAALLRLAQAVHQQGYKVALTGEGADEALAGYVWYKTQKFRDGVYRTVGRSAPRLLRNLVARSVAGRRMVIPPEQAIGGVRPAQQDLYEMISQSKPILYSEAMWQQLGDHSPYSDLDITTDRMSRWHPLNQSLYVGYKVMLAGLLMISKGDRIAMNASVETRYPYLDDDVIAFCAGIAPEYKLHGMTEKWILRQVAKKILPKKIANRPKTMFRAGWRRPSSARSVLHGSISSSAPNRSARPAISMRLRCSSSGRSRLFSHASPRPGSSSTSRSPAWPRPSFGTTSTAAADSAICRRGNHLSSRPRRSATR